MLTRRPAWPTTTTLGRIAEFLPQTPRWRDMANSSPTTTRRAAVASDREPWPRPSSYPDGAASLSGQTTANNNATPIPTDTSANR